MKTLQTFLVAALLFVGIGLHSAPALAQDGRVPLNQIVDRIQQDRGGNFMGARYQEQQDRYRIVWKQRNGNVTAYEADPNTGRYRQAQDRQSQDRGNNRRERR